MSRRSMKRILVTGAFGQIGTELTVELRKRHGKDNVVAAGHKTKPSQEVLNAGPFAFIDTTEKEGIEELVEKHDIDTVYHLAAILSATGEKNPQPTWDVNVNGLYNVLEIARKHQLVRVFWPSSIAVFGPETPRENTPQETVLRPTTMYGVTKVAGELMCNYYFKKFGIDVRGARYPGIISSETPPGGGTTDYSVAIFYDAIKYKRYTCFVREDTVLPMMYIPDCIKATLDLMNADLSKLKHHADYNLSGISFSAGELAQEIKKHIPGFVCEYKPDFRQEIADSWPKSIDDNAARKEWGWKPSYTLATMTQDMLTRLNERHAEGRL